MPRKKTPPKLVDPSEIYKELARRTKRARLMSEVEAFKSVPTIFRSFNRAARIGGAPLSCVCLAHGPESAGKSAWAIGLVRSFVAAGAVVLFVDAELAASTRSWFVQLGVNTSRVGYLGRSDQEIREKKDPLTYEEIVDGVDAQIALYQEWKRDGRLLPGTPLLVVVDSISKMVPAKFLKRMNKDGGDALQTAVGREQAQMNTAWMISLGPKVGDDDILLVLIAHEYEKSSANKWAPDFETRGGRAVVYDSMMRVRVTFGGLVRDLAEEGSPAVGKRHKVRVLKNKHGPSFGEATFYTSNGAGLAPVGFDRPRELVHEGLLSGVVVGPSSEDCKLTAGTRLEFAGQKFQLKELYQEAAEDILLALEAELDQPESGEDVSSGGDP